MGRRRPSDVGEATKAHGGSIKVSTSCAWLIQRKRVGQVPRPAL
jgi:hypothetical protein